MGMCACFLRGPIPGCHISRLFMISRALVISQIFLLLFYVEEDGKHIKIPLSPRQTMHDMLSKNFAHCHVCS